ncbi:hypothetical protein VB002_07265 [Campylobacter concisus]
MTRARANFKKVKDLEDDYGEVWYQVDGLYEVPNDALGGNQKSFTQRQRKFTKRPAQHVTDCTNQIASQLLSGQQIYLAWSMRNLSHLMKPI